jgi:azurin
MATVKHVTICALLICAGLTGGCGDKPSAPVAPVETKPEPAAAPVAPAPAAPPAAAAAEPARPDAEGIVRVTASDQMRFSTNRIEVPAGKKVKIELKNVGALPKEAMGHDLVVLKAGIDPMAFGAKAVTAKATDYIPTDAADQMLAHTKLLGPGEAQTIEFDAPPAGSYPFVCTFPGHVALMNGVLVVGP